MRDYNSELLEHFLNRMNLNDEDAAHALVVGVLVCELMRSGEAINRKTLCCKLVRQLELCQSMEEERTYYRTLRLLFGRQ